MRSPHCAAGTLACLRATRSNATCRTRYLSRVQARVGFLAGSAGNSPPLRMSATGLVSSHCSTTRPASVPNAPPPCCRRSPFTRSRRCGTADYRRHWSVAASARRARAACLRHRHARRPHRARAAAPPVVACDRRARRGHCKRNRDVFCLAPRPHRTRPRAGRKSTRPARAGHRGHRLMPLRETLTTRSRIFRAPRSTACGRFLRISPSEIYQCLHGGARRQVRGKSNHAFQP